MEPWKIRLAYQRPNGNLILNIELHAQLPRFGHQNMRGRFKY
jgi:hypothetical protein